MERKIPTTFDAVVYSDLTPTDNPNTYTTRVRTFYKYANPNKSYITDIIAQQLIESAAGIPIVGFFNRETDDFEGHMSPELDKAYGFILQYPNFAWEQHLDKDGVMREYACFDILLWTERYEEAKKILGKSQSMELNPATINGSWGQIGDDYYFIYTKASMLGLCVLGDNREPCFEGAAFFENRFSSIESFYTMLSELIRVAGGKKMDEKIELTESVPESFEKPPVEEERTPEIESIVEPVLQFEEEEEEKEESQLPNFEAQLIQERETWQEAKAAFEREIASLRASEEVKDTEIATLKSQLETFESQVAAQEKVRKDEIIKSYETRLDEDEISSIANCADTLTYDELEIKLAAAFGRKAAAFERQESIQIPLQNKGFATDSALKQILEKYRR